MTAEATHRIIAALKQEEYPFGTITDYLERLDDAWRKAFDIIPWRRRCPIL